MEIDRQKLIEAQKDNAKTYFAKVLIKKNKPLSGFIVTQIRPYHIRFFPDELLLNAYKAAIAAKDVDQLKNRTFIFRCSIEKNYTVVELIS